MAAVGRPVDTPAGGRSDAGQHTFNGSLEGRGGHSFGAKFSAKVYGKRSFGLAGVYAAARGGRGGSAADHTLSHRTLHQSLVAAKANKAAGVQLQSHGGFYSSWHSHSSGAVSAGDRNVPRLSGSDRVNLAGSSFYAVGAMAPLGMGRSSMLDTTGLRPGETGDGFRLAPQPATQGLIGGYHSI